MLPTRKSLLQRWIHRVSIRVLGRRRVLHLAESSLEQGDLDYAAELLQPYLASSDAARACWLLGRVALERGKWDEALVYFGDSLRLNPDQQWGWALYGYAALQGGKIRLALMSLQYARHQDPTNVAILECLLTIAQRIDSEALRRSVEADLMKLDPKTYSKKVAVTA